MDKLVLITTEKLKQKRFVLSLEVTKSDLPIGFSVIDRVENEVWLMDFLLEFGLLKELKFEK